MDQATPGGTFAHQIDADDRLVQVDAAWRAFGRENGLPDPDAVVLGRPLWDFITGTEVRHLYELILGRVRGGRTVSFPFRCDAPHLRRHMRMAVAPLAAGAVRFLCVLLRQEARAPAALLDPSRRPGEDVLILCSWCKRVAVAPGEWAEVEDAVARLGLFEAAELPGLSHGICPPCVAVVQGELRE